MTTARSNRSLMNSLLWPESVAVIGASRTPGKVGYEVLSNLLEGQFAGKIIPVNRSAESILGLQCFKDLSDCGAAVDLSVIALPAGSVVEAVKSSLNARAKAIVVLAAGFGEAGFAGAGLQREVVDLCSRAGVRLLGPNCLGLINTAHKMNASFSKCMPAEGVISVLSQSGAICTAMLDWAASRQLGLAKVVSIGNKADMNETDFLAALAADDQTRVIVGYLESISAGEEFIRTARAVGAEKPFVLLRSGFTKAGRWAAGAHTGHLAGCDIAYTAAFRRAGIIRAESFDSLFDYAAALSSQPLPESDRIAIITNAGGPGVMAADAVEECGMRVAALTRSSAELLKKTLPLGASAYNPIDVLGDADPERYGAAVAAAQQDEAVDAIVIILTPHAMTQADETLRAVSATSNGKPMVAVLLGGPQAQSKAS